MREVLQNGMSFANERLTCGVFTRPLSFSALSFYRVNFIGLSKCNLGDFFMSKNLKRLIFSSVLVDASKTKRIAYIAVVSALLVVCNMFFEFKFADVQFSLTIFFSAFTGVIIGPIFGFAAAFLGDLVGFLYNSGGFMYMPWIGLAMGTIALISGLVFNAPIFKFKGGEYVKISIIAVLTLLICTIGINTTAFWVLYGKGVPYFAYTTTRLFVNGQIYNSIFNYALLFAAYPLFDKVNKALSF